MSYRKHPTSPDTWYVEYREGGKLKRALAFSVDEAIQKDEDYKAKKNRVQAHAQHPRFKDVAESYLKWVGMNLADETLHNKTARLNNHIIPFFGDYRIKDLSQVILDRYAATHTRMVYRVDLAHLMALVKWMQKRKLGPLLDFKPESVPAHPQVKTIPAPEDILKFIAAMEQESHRMLLTLILFGGLRWSEAAKLRWENVDLKAGVIRVAEVENERQDVMPIPPMLTDWFKQKRQVAGYVFPGRFPGTHTKRIDGQMRAAARKTGIKINPHLLRHASATYLYQATNDIYAVQHHLRHSKVQTSQIYTRFSVEQKKRSMGQLIEHVFNKSKPSKPGNKRHDARS
jgi:integrase